MIHATDFLGKLASYIIRLKYCLLLPLMACFTKELKLMVIYFLNLVLFLDCVHPLLKN